MATADQDFMKELISHVVGFTVNITSVEAKYKMDQKNTIGDRQAIMNDLAKSSHPSDQRMAAEMKRLFDL